MASEAGSSVKSSDGQSALRDGFPQSARETAQWRLQTSQGVASARQSQRRADQQHIQSQGVHEQTRVDNFRQHAKVHDALQEKIGQSRRLVQLLTDRIKSVEASMALSRHSCAELQEARNAKRAPLQLAHARLELRHRSRPAREQKRDNFEVALEEEKAAITAAQKKLAEYASRTDKTVQALADTHADLVEDLKSKTHALRIDQDCVQTASSFGTRTFHAPCEDAASPENDQLPVSALYQDHHSGQEHRRQLDTMQRLKRAKKQEEQANALRDESTQAMRQAQVACNAANDRTRIRMEQNITELNNMLARLREAISTQEKRVAQTAETLGRTGDEMASHEGPMNLASTRLGLRQQRHHQENIKDPVRKALDTQVKGLQSNWGALESQHSSEKDALGELQRNLAELRADFSEKSTALDVDLKCQKVLKVTDMPGYHEPGHVRSMMAQSLKDVGVGLVNESRTAKQRLGGKTEHRAVSLGSTIGGMTSVKRSAGGKMALTAPTVPIQIGTFASQHRWADRHDATLVPQTVR